MLLEYQKNVEIWNTSDIHIMKNLLHILVKYNYWIYVVAGGRKRWLQHAKHLFVRKKDINSYRIQMIR